MQALGRTAIGFFVSGLLALIAVKGFFSFDRMERDFTEITIATVFTAALAGAAAGAFESTVIGATLGATLSLMAQTALMIFVWDIASTGEQVRLPYWIGLQAFFAFPVACVSGVIAKKILTDEPRRPKSGGTKKSRSRRIRRPDDYEMP